MKINCDIGERGVGFPEDLKLMKYIDIANIACGGHAGNGDSVDYFCKLARENNVKIAAHLSYPDRENFGRKSMRISIDALLNSLNNQLSLLESIHTVKLHGALYNDSTADKELAEKLALWMKSHSIHEILCPAGSFIAHECSRSGINVLAEAFAERTYTVSRGTGRLALSDRSEPYAVIEGIQQAMEQVRSLEEKGMVSAYVKDMDGILSRRFFPLTAETVCIHSDSPIALELAKELLCYV